MKFPHQPRLLPLFAVAALSPDLLTTRNCLEAMALYLPPSTPAVLPHQYHHFQYRRDKNNRISDTSLHYKEPPSPGSRRGGNDFPSSGDINNAASSNGSDNDSSSNTNNFNVWSVLANTERWISDTLDKSNLAETARRLRTAEDDKQQQQQQKQQLHFADEKVVPTTPSSSSSSSSSQKDNPYARKEISYVCETQNDLVSIVGGIFRRVREARELGESHGRNVEATATQGDMSLLSTMRQTNVVVIPNCVELDQFHTFDNLVMAINQARRAARDFVLKKKEKTKDGNNDDDRKEWVVSINCAHLHPQYGMPTPEEQITALQNEEAEGEVDVNLQEYKKRRDEARRSPYPSVIVEVLSTPPADFGSRHRRKEEEEVAAAAAAKAGVVDTDVTSEDVKRLEAMFAMSAATKSRSLIDDPFYDALGEAFGTKQIISQSPFSMAQNWVLQNDPAFNENTSTFTTSNTRHVDAAYEFVFVNLAMLNAEVEDAASAATPSTNTKKSKRGQMSYVVLPNFVPTSATSFDRFAGQVSNIIRAIPSMAERVTISTYHPEHVERSTRSPVPIVVITWK